MKIEIDADVVGFDREINHRNRLSRHWITVLANGEKTKVGLSTEQADQFLRLSPRGGLPLRVRLTLEVAMEATPDAPPAFAYPKPCRHRMNPDSCRNCILEAHGYHTGGIVPAPVAAGIAIGTGERECAVLPATKACTCGAASCRSDLHSEFCDLA